MIRRRVKDVIQDLLDPRIPLLFLFGTLVLAVLGNAVYDLLVEVISRQPDADQIRRLGLLSVGALILLSAVVAVIWLWYNARRSRHLQPLEAAVRLDDAYPALVVFVSPNPRASEQEAIWHHLRQGKLRQLWMIVSQDASKKAQALASWLRDQPDGDRVQLTQLSLSDAFEVRAAYRATIDAFEMADVLVDQLIVDITAGTKQMSVGAVLACREYGVPMQYVLAEYDDGQVRPNSMARLMKVRL